MGEKACQGSMRTGGLCNPVSGLNWAEFREWDCCLGELAVTTPFTGFSQFSHVLWIFLVENWWLVFLGLCVISFSVSLFPRSLHSLLFPPSPIKPKPKVSSVVTSMGVISRLQSRSWERRQCSWEKQQRPQASS